MNSHQRNELKKEANTLLIKGLTQKEIAKKLQTTEKTVSVWLKPLRERINKMQLIEAKLLDEITVALNNKETKSKDVRDLFASLHILKTHQLKIG